MLYNKNATESIHKTTGSWLNATLRRGELENEIL